MSPVRTLFFLDEVTDLSDGGTGVLEDCEHDVLIVSGTEPSESWNLKCLFHLESSSHLFHFNKTYHHLNESIILLVSKHTFHPYKQYHLDSCHSVESHQ